MTIQDVQATLRNLFSRGPDTSSANYSGVGDPLLSPAPADPEIAYKRYKQHLAPLLQARGAQDNARADAAAEVDIPVPDSPRYWRNPNMDKWANNSPKFKIDEIKSALALASKAYPAVPKELLGDVSGLESQWKNFQSGVGAEGPFQFMPATARGVGLMDTMNATDSARAAAKMISNGGLGQWDIIDMPGAGGNSLTDFYSEEELAPFINAASQRRREKVLKPLAGVKLANKQ